MDERYNPGSIEKKWQAVWEQNGLYAVPNSVPGKENYYQLVEFSYPSGNLHVGHWYAFAVPDIHARFQRMKGKNVLYPMGFDAFGLPAENAAIKNKKDPKDWTLSNIDYMRTQLKSMGAMFDWSREVITCDPRYYRWTQWLFIQLFKAGLVEQKETLANWCPNDKTVLANEQVVNGNCDRCGAAIEKRMMKQWQVKITKYADRLLEALEAFNWPEEIKISQRNWIGKSEGAEISFPLKFIYQPSANDNRGPNGEKAALPVFTTRPDTLFGATYLVLAPEHLWVTLALRDDHDVLENKEEIYKYVQAAIKKTEIERTNTSKEKTGVLIKGVVAINPGSGEEIPIYIADYVLAGYGTGAVMAVPAHDERDHEFAKKLNLPIRVVVKSEKDYENISGQALVSLTKELFALAGKNNFKLVLVGGTASSLIETGAFGIHSDIDVFADKKGFEIIDSFLKERKYDFGDRGGHTEHHEWNNHRHYSSEGVWMDMFLIEEENGVYFDTVGKEKMIWGSEEVLQDMDLDSCQIKVASSEMLERIDFNLSHNWNYCYKESGLLTHSGEFDGLDSETAKQKITEHVGGKMVSTYRLRDWGVSRQRYWGCPIPLIHCETCGWQAVADDQLPVILPEVSDYLPNDEGQSPLSKNPEFVNTTCPKCRGKAIRETDTLDTFVDSSWYFLRYCDPKNEGSFADKNILKKWLPIPLYSGGAEHTTLHLLYSRFFHKALFDLGLVNEVEPYTRRLNRGIILGPDGAKMSKSKGNVIDPDAIVTELGADTMRMYLAFIGPYNETGSYPWNSEGVIGVHRFLERVWRLTKKVNSKSNPDSQKIESVLQKYLLAVEESLTNFKMNTGVAALMSCSNELKAFPVLSPEHMRFYAQMLAPYAPHIAEEFWNLFGGKGSIHVSAWPLFDAGKVVVETLKMAVQVNGKMRVVIEVTPGMSAKKIQDLALADEKVQSAINGKEIKKIIIVPEKVVSIVA